MNIADGCLAQFFVICTHLILKTYQNTVSQRVIGMERLTISLRLPPKNPLSPLAILAILCTIVLKIPV